jgi:predicted metal-dependent peptidase
MERDYRGEMININAGGLTYTATPEHPFYVARRKNKSRPINLLKPVWVKAKDITSDDYVIVPKLPGTFSDKEISLDQFIVKGTDSLGRSTFANRVTVKDFPLTEETAWLLGLYAAEGSGKERITLSLGSHETALQEKVCQIAEKHLQLSCSIDVGSQHKSVVNVRFGGPVLARAFKDWCGDGAKNKKVPEFILFNKNLGIVKAFLHGLADGDACIREDGLNILGISSRLLTTQARLLLARLDIGFFGSELVQKERKIRERTIKGGGRLYNTSWRWEIKTSLRNFNGKEILSNSNRWKSLEEGIAIPIKKVFKTDFSGKVYNISTQDHTYIVDGLLVHNCDMAINSIIGKENLPEFCIIPGVRPKDKEGNEQSNPYADFIANAPLMQASDYYFEELRKIQEEQGDGDGDMSEYGIGTMDDHGGWADLPPEVQDEIRGRVEEITRKAANKADRDNSWGNISAEIQEIIRRMISRQIDWRSIVRNFVGRCRTMDRTSTIRKINKKVPYKLPGVKRQMRASFACFMDQSGSMSDEDIALLFGELEGLSQETEIDCWHFDTEIDESSHMNWKKGMGFPKVLRTRCGGTDFQAVADFCNRQENRGKWSGVIILTDGYAPVMGAINGSRVLWVITETGTMDAVRPRDLACQMSRNKQFKTY